jgi:outer membrane protein assembly factor BamE
MRGEAMQRLFILLFSVFWLSGCGMYDTYRTHVVQGNIIADKSVDELKVGMTKDQAAFIMGSPVVVNAFTPNRWEFIETLQDGQVVKRKAVILEFKNDRLQKISRS